MPFCPKCRTEYVKDKRWCADCGVELVASLPEAQNAEVPAGPTPPNRAAKLCEMEEPVEMAMLESQLHMAGIPTVRQARATALFVPAAKLEEARRIMAGKCAGPPPPLEAFWETVNLSDLHRIRLVCSECDEETTVDLLKERVPAACKCGHIFSLGPAQSVLDRYAEIAKTMDTADFDIELELPKQEG